jgi:hypothetical protein
MSLPDIIPTDPTAPPPTPPALRLAAGWETALAEFIIQLATERRAIDAQNGQFDTPATRLLAKVNP